MITVKLHPAERCQNELAACKGSWFSKERFDIIAKWMQIYHDEQDSPEIDRLKREVDLLTKERDMLIKDQ